MRRTLTAALMAALTTTLALTALPALTPAHAAVFDDHLQVLGPVVTEPRDDGVPGAALGRRFVFAGEGAGTGSELWITDGTRRGTHLVRDILPGSDDSAPNGFTYFKGRIWFQATGVGGAELWVTDGTAAGTKRVLDVAPGAENGAPRGFTVAGDKLFFSAFNVGTGRELWVTNGSATGTHLVRDLWPGATSSFPVGLTAFGDRIVFSAQIVPEEDFPFVSDGTSARTFRLDDPDDRLDVWDAQFAVVGDKILFPARDASDVGVELYRSRGARGDAQLVKDINPEDGSYPNELTVLGGAVVFTAFDPAHEREVWRSDGTSAGTFLLRDIWAGTDSGEPEDLVRSGGTVFFSANSPGAGRELWATGGTPGSTRLVRDIYPGDDSDPFVVGGLGGRVLLAAHQPGIGREFFTSDGTAAGTRLVADFYPGADSVGGYDLGRARGTFFFGLSPQEPALDGTPRLTAYTLPVPSVRATPRTRYSRATAARREIRVRVGVRAPGIGVAGRVVLYRGGRAVGSALIQGGVARVRITAKLGPGRHVLRARFLGSIDAQARASSTFVVRVR